MSREQRLESGQITQWIARLQSGDDAVVADIFRVYFQRLSRLGARYLPDRFQRVMDGEDLAAEVLQQFLQRASEGGLPPLQSRHDVWRLLCVRLKQRASNEIRRRTTLRENQGRVRGESLFDLGNGEVSDGLAGTPDDDDTALLAELHGGLMETLKQEPILQQTAELLLQGEPPDEAAVTMNCSRATVYRRLRRIRDLWAASESE